MTESRAWMVRAGNDNELIDRFRDRSIVAIGWREIGDVSDTNTREEVKRRYEEGRPSDSKWRIAINAGQLYRFVHEFNDGDLVLTYDKSARDYHVGFVSSEYQWKPEEEYPQVRGVEWEDDVIDRDAFSTPVKDTLGSALTVFSLDEHREQIRAALAGEEKTTVDEEDASPYFDDVQTTSEELISDIIENMDPFDFEELVAAVLRAMGYTARVTDAGADGGVDIIAHPDALGFEQPLIKVQVKQRESRTGSGQMRDFIGTLDDREMGLHVSTGGYTTNANNEVARTSRRVTALNRDKFIKLMIEYYQDIEPEYKTLVPLKRVYIPTEQPRDPL